MKTGELSDKLGGYLRKLETSRYSADYSKSDPPTKEEAEMSCERSRFFYSATVQELHKISGIVFEEKPQSKDYSLSIYNISYPVEVKK